MRVLLVEDNEDDRDMLTRRLTRLGHEVLLAGDGEEGVRMAASEAPALVLMDLSLPGVNGLDAIQRIKSEPATRGIPVLVLTAHSTAWDRERAEAAGCDDYDTKPVELDRLLAKMQALVRG